MLIHIIYDHILLYIICISFNCSTVINTLQTPAGDLGHITFMLLPLKCSYSLTFYLLFACSRVIRRGQRQIITVIYTQGVL